MAGSWGEPSKENVFYGRAEWPVITGNIERFFKVEAQYSADEKISGKIPNLNWCFVGWPRKESEQKWFSLGFLKYQEGSTVELSIKNSTHIARIIFSGIYAH